jgi:multiple sugar transport system ATP-binding protein
MDEPLSNLDAKLRVQMRADIAKLQHDLETTTIYVTHDQVEAMTMGDRVAVMSLGELQQVDTPQRLYDQPANLFVAGFIGTPPMNLVEVQVASVNGGAEVNIGGGRVVLSEEAVRRYPGVRRSEGHTIVLGVRSDDLYPASSRPDLPTIDARLTLVEALGSQSMAYFHIDATAVRSGAGGVEDVDEEEGDAEGVTATRPNFVAAFTPREAMGLQLDESIPVAIDVAHVHLFDRDTGEPLR